ncbi:hypothetical protein EON83_17525 [bacterium]|nr:MAG: hypothetical protein EON83_17525 [bacterium]
MKPRLFLFSSLLMLQCVSWSAEPPTRAVGDIGGILNRLKSECDNPKVSNDAQWISYCSETELKRMQCIATLKSAGTTGETQVRQELGGAKGEYLQMLVVTLAAMGDNDSIWQAGQLMLRAKLPAVRVCAALELSRLKDKRLVGPFKQALSDQFERRDGSCVGPGMIFPSGALPPGR